MSSIPTIVRNMLKSLHIKSINYCRFKSNEHLDAAKGDTDLDILFDYHQYKIVKEILLSLGFKNFNQPGLLIILLLKIL